MFSWFQRLLPQRGAIFSACSRLTRLPWSSAARALQRLTADGSSTVEILQEIRDREHDADKIIRQVLTEVRKTFLTPFDRGAITSLIGAMDDAIDEMLASARAIDLYELRELRPEMKQIVGLILRLQT